MIDFVDSRTLALVIHLIIAIRILVRENVGCRPVALSVVLASDYKFHINSTNYRDHFRHPHTFYNRLVDREVGSLWPIAVLIWIVLTLFLAGESTSILHIKLDDMGRIEDWPILRVFLGSAICLGLAYAAAALIWFVTGMMWRIDIKEHLAAPALALFCCLLTSSGFQKLATPPVHENDTSDEPEYSEEDFRSNWY